MRRCPLLDESEAQTLFDVTSRALKAAFPIVEEHKETLRRQYEDGGQDTSRMDWEPLVNVLQEQVPEAPRPVCLYTLGWVWYWHQIR